VLDQKVIFVNVGVGGGKVASGDHRTISRGNRKPKISQEQTERQNAGRGQTKYSPTSQPYPACAVRREN